MSVVVIADTTQGLKPALEEIFVPHGGTDAVRMIDHGDGKP